MTERTSYQATLWLHQMLVKKHHIPVDRDGLESSGISHWAPFNRPNCPAESFHGRDYWRILKGEDEVLTPVKIIVDGKIYPNGHVQGGRGRHHFAPVRALV